MMSKEVAAAAHRISETLAKRRLQQHIILLYRELYREEKTRDRDTVSFCISQLTTSRLVKASHIR